MSRLQECAPSRDHRAPAVPRLVPKAGAATASITPLRFPIMSISSFLTAGDNSHFGYHYKSLAAPLIVPQGYHMHQSHLNYVELSGRARTRVGGLELSGIVHNGLAA